MLTALAARRWWQPPAVVVIGAAAGVAGGIALVAASPPVLFGALGGLVVFAAMLRSPQIALLVFVAVVSLLPFGVIPLQLGAQLTLLDATLTLALLVLVVAVLFAILRMVGTGVLPSQVTDLFADERESDRVTVLREIDALLEAPAEAAEEAVTA